MASQTPLWLIGTPSSLATFGRNYVSFIESICTLVLPTLPQTDGQTERVNQCLEMFLRCSVHNSPKEWKSWLSLAELWYNSSFHTSLGCSPFKALYGCEPNIGAVPAIPDSASFSVTEVITNREVHLQSLKDNLAKAQNWMKLLADKKRTDFQFNVGDQVLLKLRPYT